MWYVIRRGALVASVAAVLAVAIAWTGSSHRIDAGSSAVWCYDGDSWLGFSAGVPGSATEETFTDCLRTAAARGEIFAFDGMMLERGALIDVGDRSIYWKFRIQSETKLYIIAYDDRVVFAEDSGREIEIRNGVLNMTPASHPYIGRERIELTDRHVLRTDFTIYVVGLQFVAVGDDGWYHIGPDRTGWNEDETPRAHSAWLFNRWPGVWIRTELDHPDPLIGGTVYSIRQPLAGNYDQLQYYRFRDWEDRVNTSLLPRSFGSEGYDFLPDWEAYYSLMKDVADAIIEDLYHGRDDRPQLELEARRSGLVHVDRNSYFLSASNHTNLLHQVARLIAGPNAGYGGTFTATLVMLWERYVPGFDQAAALTLADRYSVAVTSPVDVNPVSDRTERVNQVLTRPPAELPSDHEPIAPEDLHLSVTLEVGTTYGYDNEIVVLNQEPSSTCFVDVTYLGGTYAELYGLRSQFTVNPHGTWNGITLGGYTDLQTGEGKVRVFGTPTVPGRIRVEITTRCPGGHAQEPQVVGYSEIIVVDPAAEEE